MTYRDTDASSRDHDLVRLLETLTSELRDGSNPDVEKAARDNPDVAGDLRELWGAVMVTEAMARFSPLEDDTLEDRTLEVRERPGAPTGAAPPGPVAAPGLPSLAPAIDATLALGDFEIVREVGRGGMGVVYEATQKSLGRRVAIKVLLRGEHADEREVARFRAEAEAAAALEHPNIVSVFEVGSSEGLPYFTMPFLEGETLARRLERGPLEPREAVRLIVPVCRAVEHAHENGVLHRDLKPSNILIDPEGRPHVMDFGLAKRVDSDHQLTRSGAVVGTPAYMSPEQASGERGVLGPASDVYSIGALLYHMITGVPPFQAASAVDVILAVLERDPLPPRVLNETIDRELEMIVMKCLQKPPELRYRSAAELADDLEALLSGDPISVRSISLPLLVNRMFRETHHAPILENWGLLWMWHSVVLIAICTLSNAFQWMRIDSRLPYIGLWLVGFGAWSSVFWSLRRRGGPITFIERQIAHIWAGSVMASTALFFVEMLMDWPVLSLSPVLALVAGMVFVAKAGVLSGKFYVQAASLFLTAAPMIWFPQIGLTIFGLVSAACFFVPGLKYYRLRRRDRRER